jgi:cysteine-rich repeat protein
VLKPHRPAFDPPQETDVKPLIRVWCSLATLAVAACDEARPVNLPPMTTTSPAEPAPDAEVAECDQAPNGTPCGKPGSENHCVFFACVRNACGDGVRAGDEACDDGDEIDGDGCSARCHVDTPNCGNGILDPFEECDDGDKNGADCTARCTKKKCGDGILSPGEECDEGREIDTKTCLKSCLKPTDGGLPEAGVAIDGGSAGTDAGSKVDASADTGTDAAADAGGDATMDAAKDAESDAASEAGGEVGPSGPDCAVADHDAGAIAKCEACRQANCTNLNGFDWVSACYKQVDTNLGGDPADTTFLPKCIAVMKCAQRYQCGLDGVLSGAGCYCGNKDIDSCNTNGPATDGSAKCIPDWQAAAGTSDNMQIQARFSDYSYPAGIAFQLLDCDRQFCRECATPEATCANVP